MNHDDSRQPMPESNRGQMSAPHKSAAAIVGFVLGVLALVGSWIPIVNNLSAFAALIGLIFAVVGVVAVMRGKRGGKGLAIAAAILNVLAFIIVLGTQSMYGAALDEAMGDGGQDVVAQQQAADESDGATAEPASPAEGQEAPASDYGVSIEGAKVSEDYEGNPAIVVTYSWTNGSEDATSAAAALSFQCFQNGVQLEMAIMDEDIEGDGYMAEVKPGASTSFGLAYALDDESEVTAEVSELFSFDDAPLAEKTFSVA